MVRKSPLPPLVEAALVMYGVAIVEKMGRLSTQSEAMSVWSCLQFRLPKPAMLQSTCRALACFL